MHLYLYALYVRRRPSCKFLKATAPATLGRRRRFYREKFIFFALKRITYNIYYYTYYNKYCQSIFYVAFCFSDYVYCIYTVYRYYDV